MWTRTFWKAVAERAVKTAAQAAVLVLGADQFNVLHVDWVDVGGFAAGGAVLSVLTSLLSARLSSDAGPSLATEKLQPPVA